jgi:hypothetical protein
MSRDWVTIWTAFGLVIGPIELLNYLWLHYYTEYWSSLRYLVMPSNTGRPSFSRVHVLAGWWPSHINLPWIRSRSDITTDSQSVSPSWCQATIWDPWPIFHSPWDFLLDSCGLLFCRALSDERTGLQFIVAGGPRQRSPARVCPLWREVGPVFCMYQSIVSQYVHKVFT